MEFFVQVVRFKPDGARNSRSTRLIVAVAATIDDHQVLTADEDAFRQFLDGNSRNYVGRLIASILNHPIDDENNDCEHCNFSQDATNALNAACDLYYEIAK